MYILLKGFFIFFFHCLGNSEVNMNFESVIHIKKSRLNIMSTSNLTSNSYLDKGAFQKKSPKNPPECI